MKKLISLLAATAVVAVYAGAAHAQCDFDALAKAKGIKGTMVREFAGCGGNTQHPTPNTQTSSGTPTPACSPVEPRSDSGDVQSPYALDPYKGYCKVQTKSKLEKDCSRVTDINHNDLGLPAGPCHITYLKGKCKGVYQDASLSAPVNSDDDTGFTLQTLTRTSLDDKDNGDMTVIDFPVSFNFETKRGQLKLKGSSAESLVDLVGPVGAALPPCTQLQILTVRIVDPNGRPFATLGSGTRP